MRDFVWMTRLARGYSPLWLGLLGLGGFVGFSLVRRLPGFPTLGEMLFELAGYLVHPLIALPWLWLLSLFLRQPWREARGEVAQPARVRLGTRVTALFSVALTLTLLLAALVYALFRLKTYGGPGADWPRAVLAVLTAAGYLAAAATVAAGWRGPGWQNALLAGTFVVAGLGFVDAGWLPLTEDRPWRALAFTLLGAIALLAGLALPFWERTFTPYARGFARPLPWLLLALGAGMLAASIEPRPFAERLREEQLRLRVELEAWRAGKPIMPPRGEVAGIPYRAPKDYPAPVEPARAALFRLAEWSGRAPALIEVHPGLGNRRQVLYGTGGRWLLHPFYLLPLRTETAYWTRRLISELDDPSLALLFEEAGRYGICAGLAPRLAARAATPKNVRELAGSRWVPYPPPDSPAGKALLSQACTQLRRWYLVFELLGADRLARELRGWGTREDLGELGARLRDEGIMFAEYAGNPLARRLAAEEARELLESAP